MSWTRIAECRNLAGSITIAARAVDGAVTLANAPRPALAATNLRSA